MSEKPAHCFGCPLFSAPGPVFGPPAKPNTLLFLGEAPGKDEVANWQRWEHDPDKNWRQPNFTGGAGRVLYKWCEQTGLNRDLAEVRNCVKCRPINPKTGTDRSPTEEEIRHCSFFLSAELQTIRPNLIIALGATALYTTTDRVQIGTYRGQIIEGPKLNATPDEAERKAKVLAVYHPAFIMRAQEMWPIAVHDLGKAKKEARFPEIIRIETNYNTSGGLRCSPQEFVESARRSGYVTFDLEAEGIQGGRGKGLDLRTGQITIMGLATAPYRADALYWTPEIIALCRELFADASIEKVGQNSEGFDIPYIERRDLRFAGKSFDTLQAFHLTNSELEKNLAFIASLYTDMEYWKGPQMYKAGPTALMLGNCKDVDATTRAYLSLKQELKQLDMEDLYYNGVMPVQPVLRNMHDLGLRRDEEKAHKMQIGARMLVKGIEEKLHNVIGHDVNLDSPKQLSNLLYNTMGLPVQYKKDKKRGLVPTVDDTALDALGTLTKNPIFALIDKRRKVKKLDSTFLSLETDDRGYVHPHFGSAKAALEKGEKGSGARNGRFISWNPNFQNQPLEVRGLYVPDTEECVFVEADWSQIEWRNAMVLSGEPKGLALLTSGVDNHSAVAAECFGLTLAQVEEQDKQFKGGWGSPRFASKFIVYGLGYGRGAKDIAKQLGKDISWVEHFIARFRTNLPVYWAWRNSLEGFVSKNAYLRNAFGRRRWWYTKQVTEVYNFPPSSTAADMMYRTLSQLYHELPREATLRLTVHDSVLINCPKDVVKQTVDCVRTIMQQPQTRIVDYSDRAEIVRKYYPSGWFCPVDIHLGNNWGETKKGNLELEKRLL